MPEMFEKRYEVLVNYPFRKSPADHPLRHYSYECKATAQERPYISRPSRTQQLLDPKLAPKLTSDVPNDLLRKKGVADELLAKKDEERGRAEERASPSPTHPTSQSRKRARSISSSASDSISTISTNLSISPKRPKRDPDEYMISQRERLNFRSPSRDRKRRHRSNSSMSYSSSDRSLHRKDRSDDHRRRRHRTVSPESRGRPNSQRRGSRRSRTRSASIDKSRVARERKSMTPHVADGERQRSDHGGRRTEYHWLDLERRGDRSAENGSTPQRAPTQAIRKKRSLSPYSRRLALTQSMNMAR